MLSEHEGKFSASETKRDKGKREEDEVAGWHH